MTPTAPLLAFTRREAADRARISVDKIDAAIHRGDLKAKRPKGKDGKPGRTIVIPARALEQWLDAEPDA